MKRACKRREKKRRPWSKTEDEAIKVLVNTHGTKQWTLISEKLFEEFGMPGRSGKQCRERWHNHLESGISKAPWSKQEELLLFRHQGVLGNKWAEISNHIPGRTDNSVKNHFYSTLRKQYRKLYQTDPTADQLHANERTLTQQILLELSQLDPPEELCVNGFSIKEVSDNDFPTKNCWESADLFAAEILLMPLSPVEDFLNVQ